MSRMRFPTRQAALRRTLHRELTAGRIKIDPEIAIGSHDRFGDALDAMGVELEMMSEDSAYAARATQDHLLMSSIVGIDNEPRPMARDEIEELGDAFTQRLLLKGEVPLTLRHLLNAIEALSGPEALPARKLFLVAEGGRFGLTHPDFPLNGRLAYSWSARFSAPDIFLSTVPFLDDHNSLMQLLAWSDVDGSFHFFERMDGQWFWMGNSFNALDPMSRGKGPFDSHISGTLVMKELKQPWAHWHSQNSSIPLELLRDTDFGGDPGLSQLDGAEILETQTKSAVRRWTRTRVKKDEAAGEIATPFRYLEHLASAASANLVSSPQEFSKTMTERLRLPLSFFIDSDCLINVGRSFAANTRLVPTMELSVSPRHYLDAIDDLQIGVEAHDQSVRINGDTHFCFLVPERAFEDIQTVAAIVEAGWLSARVALCALMVDFSNPVRSRSRYSLIEHCPNSPVAAGDEALDGLITGHASAPGRQELERYMGSEDLAGQVKRDLTSLIEAIQEQLLDPDGVHSILRLAESRRRAFRKRPLHEFRSTTAHAAVDIGELIMTKEGSVVSAAPID